jgi:hypothetical protein
MHQLACRILYHLTLHHIPKQTEPVLRADSYGICAGRRIIVAAKPDRPAVMNLGIVFHLCAPKWIRSQGEHGARLKGAD